MAGFLSCQKGFAESLCRCPTSFKEIRSRSKNSSRRAGRTLAKLLKKKKKLAEPSYKHFYSLILEFDEAESSYTSPDLMFERFSSASLSLLKGNYTDFALCLEFA